MPNGPGACPGTASRPAGRDVPVSYSPRTAGIVHAKADERQVKPGRALRESRLLPQVRAGRRDQR